MNFDNIELPSNKKFGFLFTVIFILIGSYFFIKGNSAIYFSSFIISLIFGIITILNSNLLQPLNKIWMRFGLLIGSIVSPIVLGMIFLIIFTPLSIIMKIIGRDELLIKLNKKVSYWKNSNSKQNYKETLRQQF